MGSWLSRVHLLMGRREVNKPQVVWVTLCNGQTHQAMCLNKQIVIQRSGQATRIQASQHWYNQSMPMFDLWVYGFVCSYSVTYRYVGLRSNSSSRVNGSRSFCVSCSVYIIAKASAQGAYTISPNGLIYSQPCATNITNEKPVQHPICLYSLFYPSFL